MRSRLFWKICLAFWCALVLVNQGGWLIFSLYLDRFPPPPQRMMMERLAPVQLASARYAIETGGLPAFERLRAQWPARDRQAIRLAPAGTPMMRQGPEQRSQAVRTPEGRDLVLVYQLPRWTPPPWSLAEAFRRSINVIIAATLGGLLFAAALAWYLTYPLRKVQRGFEQLAGGALDTRLWPSMGRRRDEVADLARDFDAMAARLEQLLMMRDQLLHDVSHELRTPLARLNLAIALMRQDPAKAATSIERIETEVRRLDELVGETLSLARLESGGAGRESYFELGGLVDTVIAQARLEAEASGVLLEGGRKQGEDILLRGDFELMRRALENIVRNAIRHSAPGQPVRVAMELREDEARVIVRDEGPGVPPDRLAAMFDPFVRLGQQGEGFGLGLAIARRAVLALGGHVEARNRTPHGLEVTIALPVYRGEGTDSC